MILCHFICSVRILSFLPSDLCYHYSLIFLLLCTLETLQHIFSLNLVVIQRDLNNKKIFMLVTLSGVPYFHMYIEIFVRCKFLSAWITSFAISFSGCLLVMYSFGFYISEKNFILHFLKKIFFSGYRILFQCLAYVVVDSFDLHSFL